MNKRGLGRGLDALFLGDTQEDTRKTISEIPISSITPNRFQPRREFDPDRLNDLAESIKIYGVLQPIVVRKNDVGYELVAGERRLRASQLAGLSIIPALIRDYSDTEMTAVALVENLQRENLNPIEEAQAYRRLIEEFDFTQDEVSQKVGKSRPYIANCVRLLNLPSGVQAYVSRGTMTPGQARPLLVLPTPELQAEAASEIVAHSLTAREAEELARQWTNKKLEKRKKTKPGTECTSDVKEMEDRLSSVLGTKVRVSEHTPGVGNITVEYYSEEERNRILEQIEGTCEKTTSRRNRESGAGFSV